MFPSNSYMDPYFSQNKEQIPCPPYPFYPFPVPVRPDPSIQPGSYAPWPHHFNPAHSNGYSYPPGYYGPKPPFPYEFHPPNFPGYYHPYFTPMLNFPANHPQLDHTKSQTHCCGCPNHVCHGRESPQVKIDEEKPEVDLRKLPNNACPSLWFSPRNYMGRDEIGKPEEKKKEAQFPWPIVCMPEEEIKEKKEKKDTQFPWPIIWMPEDDSKVTKHQHANIPVSEETAKPSFRIIPLKFLENGDKYQTEKKDGGETMGRELREHGDKDQAEMKKVPVMENRKDSDKAGKAQPVKERESTGEKVTEKKHSKLPPVCLRVDPLPHKKPTNGSSKDDKNKKEVKVVNVKSTKDKEGKEREIEVEKGLREKSQERKFDDLNKTSKPEEDKIMKVIKVIDVKSEEGKKLKERKVDDVKRAKISEQDAAVLIQSLYRGYNVRRWDPLEKLKKIRGVHKKAQELLGKLQHVEETATQLENRERLVLSENIMNLLLQLDTIQGLLPTVREARKAVARELVSLQERLDLLEKQKAVETPTNEVQLQLEMQPTAPPVSSEGCNLISEQFDLQPSKVPAVESMPTQKEDEKTRETLKEVEGSAADLPLTRREEDARIAPEETQVNPLLEETEPTDLLPETNASENNLEAQPISRQPDNSRNVASTENAELAPEVTITESSTDASNVLSETEMHDTDVTPGVTEEIHDAEVAPILETKNLNEFADVEKVHIHASESDATEIAPGVTLSETATKEVQLQAGEVTQEESHGNDAGQIVENVELQAIESGKPSNEENKLEEDNEIAPVAAVAAFPEVKMHATEVVPEENFELCAAKVDKLSEEEDKSVENEVTALPENDNPDGFQELEEVNEPEAKVCPNLVQTDAMEVAPEVKVTVDATEVGKLNSGEKKLVEENEKLRGILEKLLEAGRDQRDIISGLSERVKGLEKKLERRSKKNKVRVKKHKPVMASSIKV